jgi:hypothetical protein
MARERLAALIEEIERSGADTRSLREALDELEAIETPSLFGRLTRRVTTSARRQWTHLVGELHESRQMMSLVSRRVSGEGPLAPEEAALVRGQLLDLLRVVPAGFIAAANWALPVPGTSVVTPWLLARLGLMPSRWREAHVLATLRKERQRLLEAGHVLQANAMEDVAQNIELEADRREEASAAASLLTHWDGNRNGVWDEDEVSAYEAEVAALRGLADAHAGEARWFATAEEQVFGPLPLTALSGAAVAGSLLVCFDGRTGWVRLMDLDQPA